MPLKIFKNKNKSSSTATGGGDPSLSAIGGAEEYHTQFERIYQDSPLLKKRPLSPAVPLDREEVHASTSDKGILVGGFCHAYAVNRICLRERHSNLDSGGGLSAHQAARQALADISAQQEKGYYTIKCISKKTIKKLQGTDKQLLLQSMTNLLVEANYLTKFQHENIVELHGMCNDTMTESCFLITERIGESLEDRILKWQTEQVKKPTLHAVDPLCPSFAIKLGYAKDIANAIQYLHQHQIIILGLMPSSIGFLAQSGRLQLCDLGTCREVSAFEVQTGSGAAGGGPLDGDEDDDDLRFDDDEIGDGERFVQGGAAVVSAEDTDNLLIPMMETGGVPRYMAPEVVTQGAGSASLVADVYSWSMICAEMITLQKAFSHYRKGEYLLKVCVDGKRPNLSIYPNLPQALEGVLRRCWRHSAEKRWNSTQVVEAIQKIIDKQIDKKQRNDDSGILPQPPVPTPSRLSRSTSVPDAAPSSNRSSGGIPMNILDESLMQQSVMEHSVSSRRRESKTRSATDSGLPVPTLHHGTGPIINDDDSLMQQSIMEQSSSVSHQRRESKARSVADSGLSAPFLDRATGGASLGARGDDSSRMGQSHMELSSSSRRQQQESKARTASEPALPKPMLVKRSASAPPVEDDASAPMHMQRQSIMEPLSSYSQRRRDSDEQQRRKSRRPKGGGMSNSHKAISMRNLSQTTGTAAASARQSSQTTAPPLRRTKSDFGDWDIVQKMEGKRRSEGSTTKQKPRSTPRRTKSGESQTKAMVDTLRASGDREGIIPKDEQGDDNNQSSKLPRRTRSGDSKTKAVVATIKASLDNPSENDPRRSKSPRRSRSGDSKPKEADAARNASASPIRSKSPRSPTSSDSKNTKVVDAAAVATTEFPADELHLKAGQQLIWPQDAFGNASMEWSNSQLGTSLESNSNHQTIELSTPSSSHEKKSTKRSSKGLRSRGNSFGGHASMEWSSSQLGASLDGTSNHQTPVNTNDDVAGRTPGMDLSAPSSSSHEKKPMKRSSKGTRKRESRTKTGDQKLEGENVGPEEGSKRSSTSSTTHDGATEEGSKRSSKSSSKLMRKMTTEDLKKKRRSSQHQQQQRQSIESTADESVAQALADVGNEVGPADVTSEDTKESPARWAEHLNYYSRSDTLDKKEPRTRSIDLNVTPEDVKVTEPHNRSEKKRTPRRTMSATIEYRSGSDCKSAIPGKKIKEKPDERKADEAVAETEALADFGKEIGPTNVISESRTVGEQLHRYSRSDTLDKKEPRRRSIEVSGGSGDARVKSEPHVRSEQRIRNGKRTTPRRTMSATITGNPHKGPVSGKKLREKPTDMKRPTVVRATSLHGFGSKQEKTTPEVTIS